MKVVFDLTGGKLSIEGDGPELLSVIDAARKIAPEISQIQIITSKSEQSQAWESSDASSELLRRSERATLPSDKNATLRQYVRSMSLDNMAERIAAIAYYVNKIEGRPAFSPKEMDGWFTMCGFQKPSQMPLSLFDAKRKYGYTESTGRGSWRISNQGENLIIRKKEESMESR